MINSFLLFISNLLFSMDVDDMEDFFDEIEVGQIIGIVFAIIAVVAVIVVIIKFAKKSKKQTDGLIEEVKDKIKVHSRQYAKRQYTWFKNQMKVHWFDREDEEQIVKSVKEWLYE